MAHTAIRLGYISINSGGGGGGYEEYSSLATFPPIGESGVIYLALNTNKIYRWTGAQYVEISGTEAISINVENIRYVSKNGNDSTGDGSINKPYLTITAAQNSITDASPTKRYGIIVSAGTYTETGIFALKANVFIVGTTRDSVRIGATSFALASDFSGSADNRSGISQATILNNADFNWTTVTSAAGKLYFNEVSFNGTVNLYGYNNATAQAQIDSCIIFGNFTISGINLGILTNTTYYGNITMTQHPGGGIPTIIFASGGSCSGTVTLNATVNDFNRRCSLFARNLWMGGLTINGPSAYVDATISSIPKNGPTITNGGNLIYIDAGANNKLSNLVAPTAVNESIIPATTNSIYSGDFGKQWFFNFAYVYASSGTDMYLTTYASSFTPDSIGRSVFITPDGAGLLANVNSGVITLETSTTTGTGNTGDIVLKTGVPGGTGVRGEVLIDASQLDMNSKKIVNVLDPTADQDAATKKYVDSGLSTKISTSVIGAANGVAPLNSSSKIDSTYLPAYVDDVLEFANLAAFPNPGESGKIYIALDTNVVYRWSGSTYVQITSGAVASVNGQTGVVVLDSDDLNHEQAVPAYWNVADGSTIKAHLDELAARREAQNTVTNEPTGFATRTESTTSFSDSGPDRTFTIAPTGASFEFYVRGVKFTKTSAETIQIPNLDGNHFIYYNASGVLSTTQVGGSVLFKENALLSIVYWNTDTNTHSYFAEERHGLVMDGETHSYLHTVFGAQYLSGLALENFVVNGNGSLATHAQFTADEGSIRDEDLLLTLAAQTEIPVLFRQGSLWRKKAADSFPVIYSGTAGYTGASGRLPYNQLVSGSWQLTQIANNDFVLVHIFATNDKETPIVAIQGTATYLNVTAARLAASTEITSLSGLPFAEFVALGSVVFESSNSYTNTPKARTRSINGGDYVDFRGTQLYTAAGVATSHNLLSGLAGDDHIQYHTDARGDIRYYTKAEVDALVGGGGSPGDINEDSYLFSNSQVVPESITGLAFSNAVVRSFNAVVSVSIDATSDLFEVFEINGIQKGSEWDISVSSTGDNTEILFSITSTGQIQYTSANYSGFVTGTMKFRASTTSV